MNTQTTMPDLYDQFLKLIDAGDEKAARDFLTANFDKFPEDLQEKITAAFFEEALEKEAGGISAVADLQKKGVDTLDAIDRVKKPLEDALKAEKIRTDLGI